MMTSQDYIQANIAAWQKLAARADLIGKTVEYGNHDHGTLQKGAIRSIRVDGGYFTIETDKIEGYEPPSLRFKIDEEREPSPVGATTGIIFCDLDDNNRQIRILLNEQPTKAAA